MNIETSICINLIKIAAFDNDIANEFKRYREGRSQMYALCMSNNLVAALSFGYFTHEYLIDSLRSERIDGEQKKEKEIVTYIDGRIVNIMDLDFSGDKR